MSVTKQLHTCERCGAGFYPNRTCNTRFCGRACGLAFNGEQAKARAAATAQDRERAKAEAKAKRQAERAVQRQAEAARRKVDKLKADAIAAAVRYAPKPCKQCGETFTPQKNKTIKCQSCVADNKASGKRAKKQQERARAKGLPGAQYDCFDPYEIFERDGWECQRCGKATPKELRGMNAMDSPELDHVICLRAGGSHTRGNTQCLCRSCNVAKSLDDALMASESVDA